MWHSHPLFEPWAQNQWPFQSLPLLDKLGFMASILLEWNKHSFSNIFQELDRLKRYVEGIQAAATYQYSNFLHTLERELQTQYSLTILQIEDFWVQRSRVNWLTQRDSNSHFFHTVAKIFHRKTKIMSLQTEQGQIIMYQKCWKPTATNISILGSLIQLNLQTMRTSNFLKALKLLLISWRT